MGLAWALAVIGAAFMIAALKTVLAREVSVDALVGVARRILERGDVARVRKLCAAAPEALATQALARLLDAADDDTAEGGYREGHGTREERLVACLDAEQRRIDGALRLPVTLSGVAALLGAGAGVVALAAMQTATGAAGAAVLVLMGAGYGVYRARRMSTRTVPRLRDLVPVIIERGPGARG